MAQQNSYDALQTIAADTATELKSVRDLTMNLNSLTKDANVKFAAKFQDMDAALEKLKSHAKPQDHANQEPANSQAPQPDPRPPFIDPVSEKCDWVGNQIQATPEFGPSDGQQRRDDGLNNWYVGSPTGVSFPMREPPGYKQLQEQPQPAPQAQCRQLSGSININPYTKVFEEKIATSKGRQFDGDKGCEKWRTDMMNDLISSAPDMES